MTSAEQTANRAQRMMFTIVVPTCNGKAALRRTLAVLIAQDFPDHEVIVMDDGSNDGTDAMLAAEFPTVRYLQQANHGPAAARDGGVPITHLHPYTWRISRRQQFTLPRPSSPTSGTGFACARQCE